MLFFCDAHSFFASGCIEFASGLNCVQITLLEGGKGTGPEHGPGLWLLLHQLEQPES